MTDATTTTTTADQAAAAAAAAAQASTAATTPWYQGKADQETIGHWDNKGWKKDDPVTIALEATKAARELQKHFGVPAEQLLKLPAKADDEAGWKAVRQRLGMPADPKDYDFSSVKYPDGRDVDAALADSMRPALHKAGVAKDAAPEVVKAVIGHLGGIEKAQGEERAATLKTERETLMKDWTPANFEFNKLTAMQGAKRLGVDPDTVAKLEGVTGYAKVMEMFRKIGAGTTEDTFVTPNGGSNPTTAAGATARLAELKSDKSFVTRYLAGDLAARREMDNLIALTTGAAA